MSATKEPDGQSALGLDERVRVEVVVRVGLHPTATVLEAGCVYELELGYGRATGVLEGVKQDASGDSQAVTVYIYDPVVGSVGYNYESVRSLALQDIDAETWCDLRMAPYRDQWKRP